MDLYRMISGLYNVKDRSVIKSIQRGVASYNGNSSTTININISTVNPAKCFVIINSNGYATGYTGGATGTTYGYNVNLYIGNLTSTNLSLIGLYEKNTSFSWQVIEFY